MKLSISSELLGTLQQMALDGAPNEICGLLFGKNGVVEAFEPAPNVATDPDSHFEIDPQILITAERAMRNVGPAILGYYHSHPSGPIAPSRTDADSAAPDNRIWLIINGQEAAAWRATQDGEIYDRFTPITLDCAGTKGQTAKNPM